MMPAPESTAQEIIEHLRALGSDENIAAMARFGIATENASAFRMCSFVASPVW